MKARIKKTGEIVNIEDYSMIFIDKKDDWGDQIQMRPSELESMDKETIDTIDWEQRRYEIAREILSARIINSGFHDTKIPVEYADKLIEELKK